MASRIACRTFKVVMCVALVVGTTILRWMFDPILTGHLFSILFYAAVLVATWRWGWRSGVLTVALSAIAAGVFILHSSHQLGDARTLGSFALFLAITTGIILCVEHARTATRLGVAWWTRALKILSLAAVYYIAARLGLSLAFFQSSATAVWPPTGLALAALLLFGFELWPGILLGAFLANVAVDHSVELAGTVAIGNTFEILVGTWMIRRFAGGWRVFDSWRGIREFLLVALLATLISATNGTTALCIEGQATWATYQVVWLTWWLGDLCSAILLTPMIVLWATKPLRMPERSRLIEAAAVAAVVAVNGLMMLGLVPAKLHQYPLTILILPVLLWTAFRFGPRVTVTTAVILNALAIWGALRGFGLQATGDPNLTLILLQSRIAIVTATGLFVAAAVNDLRSAEVELRESRRQEQKRRAELESLMEAVPAIVWVAHDSQCRLITGNRAAHEFLRLAPGNNLSKTAPPGERPQAFRVFRDGQELADTELPVQVVARTGKPIYGDELEERFADGTLKWIYGNVVPLLNDDGTPRGALATFIDVTALKQAEHALRSADQRIAMILDSMADGFVAFDAEWRYTYINEPIAARMRQQGRDARAMLGRTFWEQWPEFAKTDQADTLRRVMRDRASATFEYFYESLGRWFQNRVYPTADGGVAIFQTDITERKHGERRLTANLAITQILAESPELSIATPRVMQTICEALDWLTSAYWVPNDTGAVLRCASFWRPAGLTADEFETDSRSRTFTHGVGLPGRVWATQKPAWIFDVTKDDNFPRAPIAEHNGLHAAFAFPIISSVKFLGVMEFFSNEIREPDPELLRMFEGIGTQIAQFIERKQAEEALRRSESELVDLFENATQGLHWVAPDGTLLRANRAELQMLGYSADEYVGRNFAEVHANDKSILDLMTRLCAGETIRDYPAQLRCKNGSTRDVLIDSSGYFEGGRLVHTRCFTRDVTEAKRGAEAQARLAAIVESSADAIISKNLDGIITSWNAGAEKLYGYTAGEVIGRPITVLIPPERQDEEPELLMHVRRGEEIQRYDTIRLTKDDRRIDVSLTLSPIRDATGKVIGVSKIARDISDRKRHEAELAKLRDHLAAELYEMKRLHDLSSHLLTKHELEPLLQHVLDASVQLLGADKGLLQLYDGRNNSLQISSNVGFEPEILKNLDCVCKRIGACGTAMERGQRVIVEDVFADPSFEDLRPAAEAAGFRAVQATPFFSSQGKLLGILSTHFAQKHRPTEREFQLLDLYADQAAALIERKLADKQLREANENLEARVLERTSKLSKTNKELRALIRERERLENEILDISEREQRRIGQELHDDLGQRLTGMVLMLKVLQRRLENENSREAEQSARLHTLASEAVKLTRDLSHGLCAPLVRPEGLNEALTELLQDMREQARVSCRFVPDTCTVADANVATQFYRIAQEAVINAIKHANPKNIEVRLSTYADKPCLVIVDDGTGIPPDAAESDGLGLRTMHHRARTIGAALSVERSPNGRGTLVRCWFGAPAKREPAATEPGFVI
jgi:PAS domain S-box-containing protein